MKFRLQLALAFVLIATFATPVVLAAANVEVEVSLSPSAVATRNLADEPWFPAPLVYVSNHGKEPIEVAVFGGQPNFQLELEEPQNSGAAAISVGCGNGYEPYRILPGKIASFLLWSDPRWSWNP